ncbi:MAG: MgtC/SapB family protein [Ruminococcaceae bacterium]|nr:MgtC/SapB family protein [Oscillospiraceae bacterium]
MYIIRILIACLCGGAIGIERTLRQKDAGFRTHVIVALGAALIIIVSKYGFFDILQFEGLRADASRIASNVVTGISFLGAGMIFVKGTNIKGLTTAAGIWATAGVGLAIGCGLYITGVVATVIIIVIQILFHTFLIGFDKILANDNSFDVVIRLENNDASIERLKEVLAENNIVVRDTKISLGDDGVFTIIMSVAGDADLDAAKVLDLFNAEKEIKAISF